MFRFFIGLASVLLFGSLVFADGYEYRGGLWYYGGQAYTRTAHQGAGVWRCGIYYPGAITYEYHAYTPPVAAPTPAAVPAYTDPGWRSELLRLAAQRDKYEGEQRKSVLEQSAYLEAIKALGIDGNFRWQGYGQHLGAAPYAITGQYQQSYGATANTQFGYSYQSLAALYGTNDINSLYQQAAQLAQGAQTLSGQALQGHQQLVGQEGSNRARIADIIARRDLAVAVLQAVQGPATTEVKGFNFTIKPSGQVERTEDPGTVTPDAKARIQAKWQASAQARCVSCHSGATAAAKWDVMTYPQLPADQKQIVWMRLTTQDEKARMPLKADKSPGEALPPEELRWWFLN